MTKADGVFLWVRLVVESLLRGLGNRDSIADLQRRLRLLHSDLEALYKIMFRQIDPFYLAESSCIFQLVRIALDLGARSETISRRGRQPLSTLELSFAISANEQPDLPIRVRKQDISYQSILSNCRRVEDRLKVCSVLAAIVVNAVLWT